VTDDWFVTTLRTATRCFDMHRTVTDVPPLSGLERLRADAGRRASENATPDTVGRTDVLTRSPRCGSRIGHAQAPGAGCMGRHAGHIGDQRNTHRLYESLREGSPSSAAWFGSQSHLDELLDSWAEDRLLYSRGSRAIGLALRPTVTDATSISLPGMSAPAPYLQSASAIA